MEVFGILFNVLQRRQVNTTSKLVLSNIFSVYEYSFYEHHGGAGIIGRGLIPAGNQHVPLLNEIIWATEVK